jgi:protocatechuate 3,4-dioxygenase beta subunit
VPTGNWCLIQTEAEETSSNVDWTFFKRGRCVTDKYGVMYSKTLVLKPNGDYIMYNHAHDWSCKVDPKSYFKGWADYTCTDMWGNKSKHSQKFVFNGRTLGLSNIDE